MGPNPDNSFNIPAQPEAPRSDAEYAADVSNVAANIVSMRTVALKGVVD